MACDSVWLVVFDDYDMYQPTISAFKSKDKAMEYFKFLVKDVCQEEPSKEDIYLMAYEYANGVIYVTSVDVEE